MDATWVVPTVPASLSAVVAALAYRHLRRQNRAVAWAVDHKNSGDGYESVVVTNRGIDRARGVTVTLEPSPRFVAGEDDGQTSREVDLGATVTLSFVRTFGDPPPERVTIIWKQQLWKPASWSSGI